MKPVSICSSFLSSGDLIKPRCTTMKLLHSLCVTVSRCQTIVKILRTHWEEKLEGKKNGTNRRSGGSRFNDVKLKVRPLRLKQTQLEA